MDDKRKDDQMHTAMQPPAQVLNALTEETTVAAWHKKLLRSPQPFDAFLRVENAKKNRYPNVILYDHTRVELTDPLGSDYIHASYVDSFSRARGYVLAQAPFNSESETDFWRMVLQLRPSVIVLLTTLTGPKNEPMCTNFWPKTREEKKYGNERLRVSVDGNQQERDYDSYDITVQAVGARRGIKTVLMQYRRWNCDDTIPDNLLEFRGKLKMAVAQQEKQESRHGMEPGPVVLLCPSGVHRCGTFAALDIVCDRLAETKEHFVGLQDTVTVLRGQRWGCVEHFEHYRKLSDLVISFAMGSGIVSKSAIVAPPRQAGGQRRLNHN